MDNNKKMYVSIGKAAELIGVAVSTLRRWETENRFKCSYRTLGGHRRYSLDYLKTEILEIEETEDLSRKTYCYARVPSKDQSKDLVCQTKRLENYCNSLSLDYKVISDLGSGLNYSKKGLLELISLICKKKISKLIITSKDRLLRFGSQILFRLCDFFGTKVLILDEEKKLGFEQELASDVIEIMAVFTAKLYGKRSHKNKRSLAA